MRKVPKAEYEPLVDEYLAKVGLTVPDRIPTDRADIVIFADQMSYKQARIRQLRRTEKSRNTAEFDSVDQRLLLYAHYIH